MKKKIIFWAMLAMVLAFWMMVIGCDDGSTNGEGDTWSNVTGFSQVNGTWKAPSSASFTAQGITITGTYNNYIITFNATAKTMSASGSTTQTYSGGSISLYWDDIKESMNDMGELDGVTVSANDANHSITITYNNFSQTLTDEELTEVGLQINQNGSKLKMAQGGMEIIYTKQ
jgi:hypothetical protein